MISLVVVPLYKSGHLIPTYSGMCKSRHLIPTYPGLTQSTKPVPGYPQLSWLAQGVAFPDVGDAADQGPGLCKMCGAWHMDSDSSFCIASEQEYLKAWVSAIVFLWMVENTEKTVAHTQWFLTLVIESPRLGCSLAAAGFAAGTATALSSSSLCSRASLHLVYCQCHGFGLCSQ